MRRPIRELPGELISQIAAGEVVERPASVVRELLDNALDAGARQIAVRLVGGGVRAISVEDDGDGIAAAELPLALRRHATSKIASLADLEGVATHGLSRRGAGGDRLGRRADDHQPHRRGRRMRPGSTPAAASCSRRRARVGTTVEVRELFFSTPARRKFLKTDATELAHCLEAVRRHALARPEVGFAVWHDGKAVANWSRADACRCEPADVLGSDFIAHSRIVGVDLGGLSIAGRAGSPESARARADLQYVFVNGRHVRDKLIAHAVRAAYDDVLHGGRQPAYLLYLEIAPERVDVNVHPTKIEVRFRDSREVHQAVRKAVEAALAVPSSVRRAPMPPRPLGPVARRRRREPDRAETWRHQRSIAWPTSALRAAEPLPSFWTREPSATARRPGPPSRPPTPRRRARTGRSAAPSPRSPAPSSSPRTPPGW